MASNNLTLKVEQAMFAVIAALQPQIPEVLLVRGLSIAEYAEPCVIVECSDGEIDEQMRFYGVWRMRASVHVRSGADENNPTVPAIDKHTTRLGIISDAFEDDEVAATLSSAIPDFHVYECLSESFSTELRDRGWSSVTSFTLVCCGSTLS